MFLRSNKLNKKIIFLNFKKVFKYVTVNSLQSKSMNGVLKN